MFKMIAKIMLASIILLCQLSFAVPATNNYKCAPFKPKVTGQDVILEVPASATTGQVFFIKNRSLKSIWLDKVNKKASANAGWASYVRPGNWSALFIEKKDFVLSCAVIQPGKVDYVNCQDALFVCTPPHPILTKNRKGSFWVVEDKPWEIFLATVEKRKMGKS